MQPWLVRVERNAPFVRATIPLPRGFSWEPALQVFEVIAPTGERCPAQWERVAHYPTETHGVDPEVAVAEIIATVPPASGPQIYTVVPLGPGQARPERTCQPGPFAYKALRHLRVATNEHPLAITWDSAPVRSGAFCVTRRGYGRNFIVWVTAFDGRNVVEVDLVMHAGIPGSPHLLFETLDLFVEGHPGGLGFAPAWPEPGIWPNLQSANGQAIRLVAQRASGPHALQQRGMRWFSGVVHDGSDTALAQEIAAGAGWGVSQNWSEDWARWQAHGLPLPDLEYRRASLVNEANVRWAATRNALQTGGPYGLAADASAGVRVDWMHPWGSKYGGVTGGSFRFQWIGVDYVSCGEPNGMLEMQARLQGIMARHAIALLAPNGSPAKLETYLDASGHPINGWMMSSADPGFLQGKDGGLFSSAPPPANPPPELAEMQSYRPIDFQHYDRAFQPAVWLVWAKNSPVASWFLRLNAEMWRWSQFTQGRAKGRLNYVTANPGLCTDVGRADGHGYCCMASAYAIGNPSARARLEPWLSDYVETLRLAQAPHGLFRSSYQGKQGKPPPFGDGTTPFWTVTKGTEESLITSAFLAAIMQLGLDGETRLQDALDRWCRDGLYGALWRSCTTLDPVDYRGQRQITWTGTPPVAVLGPIVTDNNLAPTLNSDGSEVMATAGAWWLYTLIWRSAASLPADLEPALEAMAKRDTGAIDPLAWMKAQTVYKLELDDRAPLHAALERT